MKRFALISSLVLAGCSSQPAPEVQQFLLRSDFVPPVTEIAPSRTVGIGTVAVAPYIDNSSLVLEVREGEVRPARFNQWAEPLRESLRLYLANEIAHHWGHPVRAESYGESDWQYRIDVRVQELHGTVDGKARLVATWALIEPKPRRVVTEQTFLGTEPLTENGYSELARVEEKLLQQLARSIAAALQPVVTQ